MSHRDCQVTSIQSTEERLIGHRNKEAGHAPLLREMISTEDEVTTPHLDPPALTIAELLVNPTSQMCIASG